MKRSRNGAPVEIKNGNIVGPGIGDVSAVAIGRNVDEVGASVDADGSNNFILFGVDYADVRRSAVDNVNFIPLRIGRNSSRVDARLQSANRAKAAQVNHGDRVAFAVRDVSVLAVERAVAGESALMEVVPSGGEDEWDEDGE